MVSNVKEDLFKTQTHKLFISRVPQKIKIGEQVFCSEKMKTYFKKQFFCNLFADLTEKPLFAVQKEKIDEILEEKVDLFQLK